MEREGDWSAQFTFYRSYIVYRIVLRFSFSSSFFFSSLFWHRKFLYPWFFQFAINLGKQSGREAKRGRKGTELSSFLSIRSFDIIRQPLKRPTESTMINSKRNLNNRANEQKAIRDKSRRAWERKNHDGSSSIGFGTFNSEVRGGREAAPQGEEGESWFTRAGELMRKFNAAVTCPAVTKSTYNVIKSAKSALPWL